MNMMGYTNPLRSEERKMTPDYAQREMRDPGLRAMRPHTSGLGTLHHTMPHLRRLTGAMHFQGGGGLSGNPVGEVAAASRPNNFNPDPQFRQFMQLINQSPFSDSRFRQAPSNSAQFVYQGGGEVDQGAQPDPQEVASPDDELSPAEQQERQIVLNAMAALDGQDPDPEAALKEFIDTFGPRALADLQQLVEEKHAQGGDEDDEDDDEDQGSGPGGGQEGQGGGPGDDEDDDQEAAQELAQAGGGLLDGPGTGQSDEIEASTPAGRPVLLSDGEYVVDAPTVAALGDGSTKAGARRLDDMRKQIRRNAYGHDKQAKPMKKGGTMVVLKLK